MCPFGVGYDVVCYNVLKFLIASILFLVLKCNVACYNEIKPFFARTLINLFISE